MTYPLDDARREITSSLETVLAKLNYDCKVKLETPRKHMGNFAFPCFSLAPIAKKAPKAIAEDIAKRIGKSAWIEKVEAINGYVNFFINTEQLAASTLQSILGKKKEYGNLQKKRKKVIVEHTSANPNGPLHVGRARNPIIGDTIARIFKAAGYDVETQFYLDDMGKQVAILAWGVNNLDSKDVPTSSYNKPDHQMVGFYQVASKHMKDDEIVAEEIGEIVKKSESGDHKTIELVHQAYSPVLEGCRYADKCSWRGS